jgi:ribonuclease HI
MCSPDKSFPTLAEAEAFMKGTSSSASKSSKGNKGNKFYGVAVGYVPGVYTDYTSVQAQIKGCPGAKQESFATREEAQAFVNEHRRDASAPISLRGDLSEVSSLVAGKSDNPAKRQKKNDVATPVLTNGDIKFEPGMGPLPPDAEDNFDPTIKLDSKTGNIRAKTEAELSGTKLQPTGDFSGPIHVYTDGSSLGNGKVGAIGGVGVYFGPNDARFVTVPV